MKTYILLLCLSLSAFNGISQGLKNANTGSIANDKEIAYTKTINDRAQKIVSQLGLNNSVKENLLVGVIANQYRQLNQIHTYKNDKVKILKDQPDFSKEELNKEIKKIEVDADSKLDHLHKKYLSALAKLLTPSQVDQVKDGMTYNVVQVTYNGYNQMLLNLTVAQKKQIMDWLIEAREHAMDAESSDKKHAWFGKYKGRINNYLSAAGYDLKKAGKEWEERRNAPK